MFHDRTFCVQSRHIHYPTEKNIVTVINTVLKQIVFVFPCNHILWEMKSIKFELAKILMQTMKINELRVCGKMMYWQAVEKLNGVCAILIVAKCRILDGNPRFPATFVKNCSRCLLFSRYIAYHVDF